MIRSAQSEGRRVVAGWDVCVLVCRVKVCMIVCDFAFWGIHRKGRTRRPSRNITGLHKAAINMNPPRATPEMSCKPAIAFSRCNLHARDTPFWNRTAVVFSGAHSALLYVPRSFQVAKQTCGAKPNKVKTEQNRHQVLQKRSRKMSCTMYAENASCTCSLALDCS